MDRPNIEDIKARLDQLPAVTVLQSDTGVELYVDALTPEQHTTLLEFVLGANGYMRSLVAYIEKLEKRYFIMPNGCVQPDRDDSPPRRPAPPATPQAKAAPMSDALFNEFLESVREMKAIMQGQTAPGRVTHLEKSLMTEKTICVAGRYQKVYEEEVFGSILLRVAECGDRWELRYRPRGEEHYNARVQPDDLIPIYDGMNFKRILIDVSGG
jgi:hypothetical protein